MTIYLAPLVMLIGAFVYILTTNSKAQELGRAMFWCGLLITLSEFSGHFRLL